MPVAHPESFLRLDEVGTLIPPYRPTFTFPGPYIDDGHRLLGECKVRDGVLIEVKNARVLGQTVRGWLRREDALKLYEIAYFESGDVLELGSFEGLSTSILARAKRSAGRGERVDTVDLSPRAVLKTRWNLLRLGLVRGVRAHVGDALDFLRSRANAGARYGMAFVDHSHAYGPVHAACQALADVLAPGGFALFHDFNDPRNHDLADVDHAVHQAVVDGLDARRFTFFGIYGCLAVYRAAVSAPPALAAPAAAGGG